MPTTKIMVNLAPAERVGAGACTTPGTPAIPAASYSVRVGSGIMARLGRYMRELPVLAATTHAVIITDKNVSPLYGRSCKAALAAAGFDAKIIAIAPGEASKTPETAVELWNAFAEIGVARDWCVVALGGGVVGDMAGFVAATWMRGIPVVQVPTSLLAFVDASVGGKTALDLPAAKNAVGAFWQPVCVVSDVDCLATLPVPEVKNGLAEAIKTALVSDEESVFWLCDAAQACCCVPPASTDVDFYSELVARAVVAKADIVGADVLDKTGTRARLNYGHTLGHAIEACMLALGNAPLGHGMCVSVGMRVAGALSVRYAGLSADVLDAQNDLLDAFGLALDALPVNDLRALTDEALRAALMHDKKNCLASPAERAAAQESAQTDTPSPEAQTITMALLADIGECCLAPVPVADILAEYRQILAF